MSRDESAILSAVAEKCGASVPKVRPHLGEAQVRSAISSLPLREAGDRRVSGHDTLREVCDDAGYERRRNTTDAASQGRLVCFDGTTSLVLTPKLLGVALSRVACEGAHL